MIWDFDGATCRFWDCYRGLGSIRRGDWSEDRQRVGLVDDGDGLFGHRGFVLGDGVW